MTIEMTAEAGVNKRLVRQLEYVWLLYVLQLMLFVSGRYYLAATILALCVILSAVTIAKTARTVRPPSAQNVLLIVAHCATAGLAIWFVSLMSPWA